MDIPANIINGIMMNSILKSILDNDCQAHDDDRHEHDNQISNCGHFSPNTTFSASVSLANARLRSSPSLYAWSSSQLSRMTNSFS